MGQLVGGIIGVWILSMLAEYLIFKRVMNDPLKGKMAAVVTGYALAVLIAGYGMANGGPPRFAYASGVYFIGLLLVGFFNYRKGLKLREEQPDELAETFH